MDGEGKSSPISMITRKKVYTLDRLKNSKFWTILVSVQEWMLMILGVLTTLIVAATSILSSFLNINFPGNEELLIFVVFYLYMIGCAYGAYEKSHITAEILDVIVKDGIFKETVYVIRWILTFLLGVVFMIWAISLVQWSFANELKTLVFRMPIAIGQSSIVVGLVLTNFYNFIHMYEVIKAYIKKRSAKKGSVQSAGGDIA
jgi:TRAP-type C4-dicarboxylate transport system permease small subunit